MRWFILGGLTIVIAVVAAIIMLPAAYVMKRVSANDEMIQYAAADGTIWDGEVQNIRYGIQEIGDAQINSSWLSLLTARLSSDIRLTGTGLNGRAQITEGLGGGTTIKNLRVLGSTEDLVNIAPEIRDLAGEFTLDVREARLTEEDCKAAQGTVWTDILTKMERRYRWTGPELSGPVTCENGRFILMLGGQNSAGENVSAKLEIGMDGFGSFTADVTTPIRETSQALTLLGFASQGGNVFRYQHALEQ